MGLLWILVDNNKPENKFYYNIIFVFYKIVYITSIYLLVIFCRTQSIWSTWIICKTWYFAHVIFTYFIICTIFVFIAFNFMTSDMWISMVSRFTITNRSMVNCWTLGMSSTNYFFTYGNTLCLYIMINIFNIFFDRLIKIKTN